MGRRAVVRANGQPLIRATHDKTLEITAEVTLSQRATCVVGVAAAFDPVALGLLRGPVRITLAAGGHRATGAAVVNPTHAVTDRIVVRRSEHRDADTFAVRSTLVAADLDGPLVAALADPDAEVTMTVTEIGARRPLVLLGGAEPAGRLPGGAEPAGRLPGGAEPAGRLPGGAAPAGRLGLLWRHADARVDLRGPGPYRPPDAASDALAGDGIVGAVLPAFLDELPGGAASWLGGVGAAGARFAALSGPDPRVALLAAGLPAEPAVLLGRVDRRAARVRDIAQLVASAPVPAVLRVPVADASAVLGPLAAAAPEYQLAVEDDPLDVGVAMSRTTARHCVAAVERFPGETATVVLPARGSELGWAELGAVVRRLAGVGVPPRTLSEALGPLGVARRDVYDALP